MNLIMGNKAITVHTILQLVKTFRLKSDGGLYLISMLFPVKNRRMPN